MAESELPTASDSPAPPASPEPGLPEATDTTAIQEKGPADLSPPPTTAVTAAPPPAAAEEEAPPRKPSPEALARRTRVLDALLVGLVLLLAFFLGSFAIQNSDFWMHLATGRLFSQGALTFGADPFSHTTAGEIWVNHSWLFDWLLYGLYQLIGGAGLVVCRGLLLAALAETLLRMRRPEQSLWIPAVCVTLALLTLSVRLPFQPVLVSVLFLGLTLYLLHRAADEGAVFSVRGRRYSPLWLLPPLFTLWVNLDAWFLLGPFTVALFLIGAGVQRLTVPQADGAAAPAAASAGDVRTLGLVLAVGVAACLLNPYTYRAFTLPLELAYPLAGVLPDAIVPAGVAAERVTAELPKAYEALSPFAEKYWANSSYGLNAAGLAYFPLLLLGVVSFALLAVVRPGRAAGPRRFPVGIFLIWAALALLSASNARLMPLFAVVAAPAVALNFQELARRRPPGELTWPQRNWALAGRVGTALALLGLLLFAWPGWLHGAPDDPRHSHRVRWQTYTDPSIERAAARLDELLATGMLRHGFNLTSELANYFAWYAGPNANTFFDQRFALPAQAAADYARARRALRDEAAVRLGRRRPAPSDRKLSEVARVFRAYRVNYLVLTDLHFASEAQDIASRLILEPARWPPLYADGRTAIFGWRDPARADNPFAGLSPDTRRRAFGDVPEGRRAPTQAPVPPDGPPSLWDRYAVGLPPVPLGSTHALAYLNEYRLVSPFPPRTPRSLRWCRPFFYAAELAGWVTPNGAAPAVTPVLPAVGVTQVSNSPRFQDRLLFAILQNPPGPPALPLLAVRTARRAVAEAPGDGSPYAALAQAYLTLWRDQEHHWERQRNPKADAKAGVSPFITRQKLRHAQYAAALTQALRFQPDNTPMHFLLAQFFEESNFPDAALEHARLARDHAEAFRLRSGAKEGAALTQAVEDQVRRLTEEVKRRTEEYDRNTTGERSLLGKFKMALFLPTRVPTRGGSVQMPRGLIKLALKVMGEVDPKELSKEERQLIADLQIHLMLLVGMTRELRETFSDPETQERLRATLGPSYEVYAALYAAAVGNYTEADKALAALASVRDAEKHVEGLPALEKRLKAEQDVPLLAAVFALPPSPVTFLRLLQELGSSAARSEAVKGEYLKIAGPVVHTAEILALRGLLALEQGDNRRALDHFRASLRLTRGRADFPSRLIVQHYVRLMETYWGQVKR